MFAYICAWQIQSKLVMNSKAIVKVWGKKCVQHKREYLLLFIFSCAYLLPFTTSKQFQIPKSCVNLKHKIKRAWKLQRIKFTQLYLKTHTKNTLFIRLTLFCVPTSKWFKNWKWLEIKTIKYSKKMFFFTIGVSHWQYTSELLTI